jgi:hypothetical protein
LRAGAAKRAGMLNQIAAQGGAADDGVIAAGQGIGVSPCRETIPRRKKGVVELLPQHVTRRQTARDPVSVGEDVWSGCSALTVHLSSGALPTFFSMTV